MVVTVRCNQTFGHIVYMYIIKIKLFDLTLSSASKIPLVDVQITMVQVCRFTECVCCQRQCVNPDETHLAEGKQTQINIRGLFRSLDWGGKEDQSTILQDLDKRDVLYFGDGPDKHQATSPGTEPAMCSCLNKTVWFDNVDVQAKLLKTLSSFLY